MYLFTMHDISERVTVRARIAILVGALSIIGLSLQSQSQAQTAPPTVKKPAVQKPAVPKPAAQTPVPKKGEAPPEPEHMILDTKDGVKLKCTYFASPKSLEGEGGHSVVPIILLHDWEGDRRQLLEFGAFLQSVGHAAIIPDLRGHGESTQVAGGGATLDATRFRKGEVTSAQKDIERCKKYLVQRHNEGQVNIDLLCVVAVGKTGVLAVQWTLNDWFAFPPFNPKGIKQGQDVKALLLVSPQKKLAGISMVPNLKHPLFTGANGNAIPMAILWGASDEMVKDSEAIFKLLEKARPDVSDIDDKTKRFEQTTLFKIPVNKSKFSGVELMKTQRVNGLWGYAESLLFKRKIAANAGLFPWKSREAPESDE